MQSSEMSDRQRLLVRLGQLYVKRQEDLTFGELADDMVDRTLVEPEGRALILAAPSGAGKTTIVRRSAVEHPDLSMEPDEQGRIGMAFVQVPAACSLSDLGAEIARAVGYPVKDGLKANVAWGAAMRRIKDKKIRFLWIDEFQNVTELANVREARKIRNTVKMSLINRRHTMGLIISGDTSITSFLRSDAHILRRSDVMEIKPVGRSMFKVIAKAIVLLAEKADMKTAHDLAGEIVPRLVHAVAYQFGAALEMTRITILRASTRAPARADGPRLLTLDDYARNWARANSVGADENPFVSPLWAKLDCAAILARKKQEAAGTPPINARGRKARS